MLLFYENEFRVDMLFEPCPSVKECTHNNIRKMSHAGFCREWLHNVQQYS